jgi:hypothetical protein
MLEAERALAQASLGATPSSLLEIIRDCPGPGVLISRNRTIITCNDAFLEWLGGENRLLTGADITSVIQVRTARSLIDVWSDMLAGRQSTIKAHVLHVAPGRAKAAQATIIPLRSGDAQTFHAVMWLESKSARAAARKDEPAAAVSSAALIQPETIPRSFRS